MTTKLTCPLLIQQRYKRDKENRRKYRQRVSAERRQAKLEAKAEKEQKLADMPAIVSAAAEQEMEPQKLRVLLRDRDVEKFRALKSWVNVMAAAVDDLDSSKVWRLYRDRAAVMRDRADCEMAAHYLGSRRFYIAKVINAMKGSHD